EQTSGLPVLTVDIDRARAARYGLNMADVQETVAIAVGGRDAGLFYQGDRRFNIGVRLPEGIRADVEALRRLPIPLPKGSDARTSYI
ncbi:efflux RND transporter permease subunit, partial [Burkholderia sp. SIMBA_019]